MPARARNQNRVHEVSLDDTAAVRIGVSIHHHASASRADSGNSGKPDSCAYGCADSEAKAKGVPQAQDRIRAERTAHQTTAALEGKPVRR